MWSIYSISLQWRHNERDRVSNHSLMIVYWSVNSVTNKKKKHQSSASLAFVRELTGHRWIPHKGPVTRKIFPFDNVIMFFQCVKIVPNICKVLLCTDILQKSQNANGESKKKATTKFIITYQTDSFSNFEHTLYLPVPDSFTPVSFSYKQLCSKLWSSQHTRRFAKPISRNFVCDVE